MPLIGEIWKYGHIWVGEYVNEKTINYIVKYINKIDEDHKGYEPKVLCSAGIGKGYLNRTDSKSNKYNGTQTKEYYRTKDGSKIALPTYYRNKIYSEEEREKLWINMLNKNIRYVNGIKIDISKTEDTYYKLLDEIRLKNSRLGYGDDTKNWDKLSYIEKTNMLKYVKRYQDSKR